MKDKDLRNRKEIFRALPKRPLPLLYAIVLFSALSLTSCTKNPEGSITVITNAVTDITESSAKTGGSVTSSGYSIGECGVCYGESHNPSLNDSFTKDHKGSGSFISTLDYLKPLTTYYVRAYAKTSSGIEYGNELSFTTKCESFSVSENTKVRFSPGNLQYQASTNTWRFAEHQWDFVGTQGFEGNVYGSDNHQISPTYDGWIDLFGWGTSGYDHGAVCYQPYSTSENQSDYYAYGSSSYNLFDQTGKADWGYNVISNGGNTENTWRTLTKDEWAYVLNYRTTASGIRYAKATVNGVSGLILLPDGWRSDYFDLNSTNSDDSWFSSNTITASTWDSIFEPHGAAFLPAAGNRHGTVVQNGLSGYNGQYWTSSIYGSDHVYSLYFCNFWIRSDDWDSHEYGNSVRLVCPVE